MLSFYHPRWPVFYEDNHLLVVYKPAGLIMQRDHKNKANLLDLAKLWIKARYAKPGNVFAGMVHRLDGPVAGVVALARTSKAAGRLSDQFRRGTIEKQYLAVVEGRPPDDKARLENWLVRDGRHSRIVSTPVTGSQDARLNYRRIASSADASLLGIRLETGRRHQIRVQLAGIGCPIAGDVRYGASKPLAHGRIALLARGLACDHPTTKVRMAFEAAWPVGWPWPVKGHEMDRPLWTIEEYQDTGLSLPTGVQ